MRRIVLSFLDNNNKDIAFWSMFLRFQRHEKMKGLKFQKNESNFNHPSDFSRLIFDKQQVKNREVFKLKIFMTFAKKLQFNPENLANNTNLRSFETSLLTQIFQINNCFWHTASFKQLHF